MNFVVCLKFAYKICYVIFLEYFPSQIPILRIRSIHVQLICICRSFKADTLQKKRYWFRLKKRFTLWLYAEQCRLDHTDTILGVAPAFPVYLFSGTLKNDGYKWIVFIHILARFSIVKYCLTQNQKSSLNIVLWCLLAFQTEPTISTFSVIPCLYWSIYTIEMTPQLSKHQKASMKTRPGSVSDRV